ncbi:MAG: hypothetical protein R3E79_27870 [Caldilineaceae bacterium]
MRRVLMILGVIAVLTAAGWGYQQYQQAQEAAEQAAATQEAESVDDLANVIWASGKLTPVTWAGLSPATTGIVSRLHVHEGSGWKRGSCCLN